MIHCDSSDMDCDSSDMDHDYLLAQNEDGELQLDSDSYSDSCDSDYLLDQNEDGELQIDSWGVQQVSWLEQVCDSTGGHCRELECSTSSVSSVQSSTQQDH